jgi:hypothetical protein
MSYFVNVFILAIIGIAIISATIFGIFMSGENPVIQFPTEHYEIEITGLKDTYLVGEQYSFSYILSGFGSPCGGIWISYPINKTNNFTVGSIPSCLKSNPIDFVLDAEKTYGTTYGHVALEEIGNYTARVQFEKGVNGPTVTEKSFMVISP